MADPKVLTVRNAPPVLDCEGIEAHILATFPAVASQIVGDELTIFVHPNDLVGLIRFTRDDETLSCELLADLSGVHWPAGDTEIELQPATSGWPVHRISREFGVIEVNYIVRSLSRNHWFRIVCGTPDDAAKLPSVTGIHPTANWHEREVYDMFGVDFVGHPELARILMPDDWLGHPQRKDYPLGGIDVEYKNAKHIPPPNERDLREIVE